jgi:hypothetical protein
LKAVGPIDLYPMLQQSLESGDELHNRVNSFTLLLAAQLSIGMVKVNKIYFSHVFFLKVIFILLYHHFDESVIF